MNATRDFFNLVQELQSTSQRGDLVAWKLKSPQLKVLAKKAAVDWRAYRVTLKTMYRLLLRRARARYQRYALYYRKQSQTLRIYDGTNSTEQLLAKARELSNYAEALQEKLLSVAA